MTIRFGDIDLKATARTELLDLRNWVHVALVAVLIWLAVAIEKLSDVFTSPGWIEFGKFATQDTWSSVFLVLAFLGVIGLLLRNRAFLILSTLALSTTHITVAWLLFLSPAPTAGYGTYAIIAALGYALCLVRILDP